MKERYRIYWFFSHPIHPRSSTCRTHKERESARTTSVPKMLVSIEWWARLSGMVTICVLLSCASKPPLTPYAKACKEAKTGVSESQKRNATIVIMTCIVPLLVQMDWNDLGNIKRKP